MNTADVTVSRGGTSETVRSEVLDPLRGLFTAGPGPHASVGITVGTQLNFGEVKVTAHVSYQCDQNETTVNRAGELAFGKAMEFLDDGLKLLTGKEGPG